MAGSEPESGGRLEAYRSRRDFGLSPEPSGETPRTGQAGRFVIQKHAARRLHFDFRLELDGALKSWAVTKGPSMDPSEKRLAVRTEDHPLDYGDFEGRIPAGQYGGGTVMLWDAGRWEPDVDPREGLERGSLKFHLRGRRLRGGYALVRMKTKEKSKRENWLLVKEKDSDADPALDPVTVWTDSISSHRSMEEIEAEKSVDTSAEAPPQGHFVEPQLATLADRAPEGDDWLHEIKYDGYRLVAVVHRDAVRLYTRSGQDWTERFPSVAEALALMDWSDTVVDGEVVALDEKGYSRFSLLQQALKEGGYPFYYVAFDLLRCEGEDLRRQEQLPRKDRLRELLQDPPPDIRYSDHQLGRGAEFWGEACRMGLEGIISKQTEAPYRSRRTRHWLKTKCAGRDDFVIAGYRPSSARDRPFASLLLGEYQNGQLHYRGRVGTGFNARNMPQLTEAFRGKQRDSSPFVDAPRAARRDAQWLEPQLLAEIQYTERTADGYLRHPVFLGLREDRDARQLRQSESSEQADEGTGTKEDHGRIAGVRLSHPDRVLFPRQGVSKQELAQYLSDGADFLLPHLARRPLMLLRCPRGRESQCFFQKHHGSGMPRGLHSVNISEREKKRAPYIYLEDREGLVGTAQLGVLELHIWGSRIDSLEQPDRLVFDLDPDETTAFGAVRDAAVQLRETLAAAELESFVLLTGGKGLHLVLPLAPYHDWSQVKRFARGIARGMAAQFPKQFVATASKEKRKGKIFIDWLRNERGATAIAPFSTRARPGCPVAVPVSWLELSGIGRPDPYHINNIRRRLSRLEQDPWADYFRIRQRIPEGALELFPD